MTGRYVIPIRSKSIRFLTNWSTVLVYVCNFIKSVTAWCERIGALATLRLQFPQETVSTVNLSEELFLRL